MHHAILPDDWRRSGQWLPYNGHQLFVTTVGEGPPLLLLHGFPTASYDFSRVVSLLQSRFQLVMLDYPGFGFSDKPRAYPYSLFTYADAAQVVAAHHRLEAVNVLAHDIGDSVALELLRRGSPVVTRLFLLNGSVFSVPFADIRMRVLQRVLLDRRMGALAGRLQLLRRPIFARYFTRLFGSALTLQEIDAFWSLLRYNDGPRVYHLLLRYMVERWEHQNRWLDALQIHNAPLVLIWGQDDPVAPPSVADAVVARRPDAGYVRLHGVRHYPHWEVPARVAAAVNEFAR